MRPFEILSCLLTLPALVVLFAGAWPVQREVRLACILLLAALIAHGIWEGLHWQLLPAYFAIVVLLLASLAGSHLPRTAARPVAGVCLLALCASLALSYVLPMFRLPKPTGPYPVGTRILHLVDENRKDDGGLLPSGKRELMVQVWYPASPKGEKLAIYRRRAEGTLRSSYFSVLRTHSYLDAPVNGGGGRYPILLFNPAWNGQRTQNTAQMEELASHGFVVAAIDHTYDSGLVAFPGGVVIDSSHAPQIGNFERFTVAEQIALGEKYVRIEALDDLFVLDQLLVLNQQPSSAFYQRLDPGRVGAFGHSLGGAVAAEACALDPRIKAVLNMDGWMLGVFREHGLNRPLMFLYEDAASAKATPERLASGSEADRRYWQATADDFAHVDASLRQFGGYRLYLAGAGHWDFTDRVFYSPLRSMSRAGTILPNRAQLIVNRYTLAFFSHFLNGANEPLLEQDPSPYPEITIEIWKPGAAR